MVDLYQSELVLQKPFKIAYECMTFKMTHFAFVNKGQIPYVIILILNLLDKYKSDILNVMDSYAILNGFCKTSSD